MDVLGFSATLTSARDVEALESLAENLRRAMNEASKKHEDTEGGGFTARVLTDNLVVTKRVDESLDGTLYSLASWLAVFQATMHERGFAVRGAIAHALAVADPEIVVSQGLVEANHFEKKVAQNPRIILCTSVLDAMTLQGVTKGNAWSLYFQQDTDDLWFIDYLVVDELFLELGNHEPIKQHAAWIAQQVAASKPRSKVRRKYKWLARYHNAFCRKHKALLRYKVGV